MNRITKRMRFVLDSAGNRVPLLDKDGKPILVQRGKHKGQPAYKKVEFRDQSGRPIWDAVVYLGRHPTTGKPQLKQKSFATEREARRWATSQKADLDNGLRPATSNITFAAYVRDSWLPTYRTQVRSSYNLEKTLGKWVLTGQQGMPPLGGVPMRKLTVDHFDKFYVAMSERGMGARGIEHLHGLLKRALKAAVRKGELPRNPADFATLPKPEVRAEIRDEADEDEGLVQALSQEQAVRFLSAAKQDRYSALWHVLLDGGLRPGEAYALQWRHVDFTNNLVQVRATLTRLGVNKKEQGWKLTKPKTKTSRRDVPVSETTLRELRRWKKQQATERLQMGPEWKDHGFVFTTETGTPLGNNMRRFWDRVMATANGERDGDLGSWQEREKRAKQGPTPHRRFTPNLPMYALRHTCATLLLLDGVDLLEVSRRLGHTDLAFTARTYGHVKAEHSTRSAASFDRRFGT